MIGLGVVEVGIVFRGRASGPLEQPHGEAIRQIRILAEGPVGEAGHPLRAAEPSRTEPMRFAPDTITYRLAMMSRANASMLVGR